MLIEQDYYTILDHFVACSLMCDWFYSCGVFTFNRLIIADELDYLITKDRAVLHDLFMLTTFPFSRCILIGTIPNKCISSILDMNVLPSLGYSGFNFCAMFTYVSFSYHLCFCRNS
jgi:hypothetical protein